MHRTDAAPAGGTRSLIAALIHFDVSCMVWTILGALGIYISRSDVAAVARATQAGTGCGTCRKTVASLLQRAKVPAPAAAS